MLARKKDPIIGCFILEMGIFSPSKLNSTLYVGHFINRTHILKRGLRFQMPFSGNRIFPPKNGKFLVPSIWELPLPGPDSLPALGTGCFPVSFKVGKHSGISECFPN